MTSTDTDPPAPPPTHQTTVPLAPPPLDPAALAGLRAPAVHRLLTLRSQGRLTGGHVRLAAQCLDVSERTMWRWLREASASPAKAQAPGERGNIRFEITGQLRVLLAYWHGNVSAVHRELVARARMPSAAPADAAAPGASPPVSLPSGSPTVLPGGAPAVAVPLLDPVPSLSTLLRAVRRDLSAGERAGLRAGSQAARALDVFASRPPTWRNHTWEADHVQAPVLVDADGTVVRPHVTWFVDTATKAITGLAITPGSPTRASVLAALRAAVLREGPYGPAGGVPENLRIDRGKDFLSRTVTAAFGALGVKTCVLPPYSPHLKGTVENLNGAVDRMLFAALPGDTTPAPPRRRNRERSTAPDTRAEQPLLSFRDFTSELLNWVTWWNTAHRPRGLRGRTPLETWQGDPTPVADIPADLLWALTLEDTNRSRTITSHGVRFRNRDYLADWMTGQVGRTVSVRHMPHHLHEIELCDPATGRHLGTAYLADAATDEQLAALRRARATRARRLRADAKAAEALRRERFAPTTTPDDARRLVALTAAEADRELDRTTSTEPADLALPDLVPPASPPPGWALPISRTPATRRRT